MAFRGELLFHPQFILVLDLTPIQSPAVWVAVPFSEPEGRRGLSDARVVLSGGVTPILQMAQLENIEAIEARLWRAADLLRSGSELASNEYFMPVMGLFLLRHSYSRFQAV